MNTERVLARILTGVESLIKQVVRQMTEDGESLTLYGIEEQTHVMLAQIGSVIVQEIVTAQGSGIEGTERACPCGGQQRYQDRARPLTVQTSVGPVHLAQRAYYRCAECGTTRYPLDDRLGLGAVGTGRTSRYLQEQMGWLLGLMSARQARQTLQRFAWPAVAASQIREKGEALGAELEQAGQAHLAALQIDAAQDAPTLAVRQGALGTRLYAAPDGVMYCTTGRDATTGQAQWRELKVAAVYEGKPQVHCRPALGRADEDHLPVRERIRNWLQEQDPTRILAAPDQAVRITYVAETASWEQFGQRLWGELRDRGLERSVTDLAVVADGSRNIDQTVDRDLRLPGVQLTRILDIAHAQQHLWDVAKAVFGETNPAGMAWVRLPLRALEHGHDEQIGHALETLSPKQAGARPGVEDSMRKTSSYFQQRREQIAYPRFVAAGYQIGSGLAESACKRFGTDRMKGTGMRWTVAGAQQVATLRMFILSDRWNDVSYLCRSAVSLSPRI